MSCVAGGWAEARDCAEWGVECGGDGYCRDLCSDAERTGSNIGCEYWAAPLPNYADESGAFRRAFDFRVVLANPGETPAHVAISRGAEEVWAGEIEPHGGRDVVLPWIDGLSFGVPQRDWSALRVPDAYRIRADQPVIATQFNPFEYVADSGPSYTNDASLLLPVHALTGSYVAASYAPLSVLQGSDIPGLGQRPEWTAAPGYIALIGTHDDTRVTVTSNAPLAAGDGVGAWSAGTPQELTLDRGEIVVLPVGPVPTCDSSRPGYVAERTTVLLPDGTTAEVVRDYCPEAGLDPTGARIIADHPVAAFGGHVCAYVPVGVQACDHLEEQLPPAESWGRVLVGAPLSTSAGARNVLRIIALRDGTDVRIRQATGEESRRLESGAFWETVVSGPFAIEATEPIEAVQLIRGQEAEAASDGRGDPSMVVLVPSEQYRTDYSLVLPTSYSAATNGQNYVQLVRRPGVHISLDGASVAAGFEPAGAMEIATVPIDGGAHRLTSREPFGVITFGLGSYTSYATPGGLNLVPINGPF